MRNKRLYFIGLLVILIAATLLPLSFVYAADSTYGTKTVTVKIVTKPVVLNASNFVSQDSQYPLLEYKNIIYFPMTYYNCGYMGLKSQWDSQTGLSISKSDTTFYEYVNRLAEHPNGKTQTAQLPDFPISVNGKSIDNSTEENPVLLFRDVTYFPLTKRYTDEFDWEFHNEGEVLALYAKDVVWKNPNHWNVQKESNVHFQGNGQPIAIPFPFLGTPGKDGIPVMSDTIVPALQICEFMNDIRIPIYSQSDHPIAIEDLELECQVVEDINGRDEVVYRLVLPPINVKVDPHGLTVLSYPINFWKPTMHGKYNIDYINWNPILQYRELDTGREQSMAFGLTQDYNRQRTDFQWLILK